MIGTFFQASNKQIQVFNKTSSIFPLFEVFCIPSFQRRNWHNWRNMLPTASLFIDSEGRFFRSGDHFWGQRVKGRWHGDESGLRAEYLSCEGRSGVLHMSKCSPKVEGLVHVKRMVSIKAPFADSRAWFSGSMLKTSGVYFLFKSWLVYEWGSLYMAVQIVMSLSGIGVMIFPIDFS